MILSLAYFPYPKIVVLFAFSVVFFLAVPLKPLSVLGCSDLTSTPAPINTFFPLYCNWVLIDGIAELIEAEFCVPGPEVVNSRSLYAVKLIERSLLKFCFNLT